MNPLQQSHAPRFERKVSDQSLPDHCAPWLTLNTSLTEALAQVVGELSVVLLHQSRASQETTSLNPFADQFSSMTGATPMNSTAEEAGTQNPSVREVLLCCQHQPLVYASTLYDERLHDLIFADLGTTPLGTVVFTDIRFKMSAREWGLSHLPEHVVEVKNCIQPVWTRSTLYQFQVDACIRYPLVITESLLFLTHTDRAWSTLTKRSNEA